MVFDFSIITLDVIADITWYSGTELCVCKRGTGPPQNFWWLLFSAQNLFFELLWPPPKFLATYFLSSCGKKILATQKTYVALPPKFFWATFSLFLGLSLAPQIYFSLKNPLIYHLIHIVLQLFRPCPWENVSVPFPGLYGMYTVHITLFSFFQVQNPCFCLVFG